MGARKGNPSVRFVRAVCEYNEIERTATLYAQHFLCARVGNSLGASCEPYASIMKYAVYFLCSRWEFPRCASCEPYASIMKANALRFYMHSIFFVLALGIPSVRFVRAVCEYNENMQCIFCARVGNSLGALRASRMRV